MKSRSTLFISLILIVILFTCSNTDGFYTIEIVEGVNHISNKQAKWNNELGSPGIDLEFIQKIGDLDATDENYILFGPADIYVDAVGNYYVLDAGNFRIQKYDSDGQFITTIGREGQGPGEMRSGFTIKGDREGNILVIDPGNNRIQKFSPDGKDLGSTRMPVRAGFIELLSNGEMVTPTTNRGPNSESGSLISIYDVDGNFLREMGKSISDSYTTASLMFFAVDADDNIICTFYGRNEILKFSKEGKQIFITDRPLNFSVPERPEKQSLTGPDGNTIEIPIPTIVSLGIKVDEKNRIWAMTLRDHLVIDETTVFDPTKTICKICMVSTV